MNKSQKFFSPCNIMFMIGIFDVKKAITPTINPFKSRQLFSEEYKDNPAYSPVSQTNPKICWMPG